MPSRPGVTSTHQTTSHHSRKTTAVGYYNVTTTLLGRVETEATHTHTHTHMPPNEHSTQSPSQTVLRRCISKQDAMCAKVHSRWRISHLYVLKCGVMWLSMSTWNKHVFIDLNAKVPEGQWVCARTKSHLSECMTILIASSSMVVAEVS